MDVSLSKASIATSTALRVYALATWGRANGGFREPRYLRPRRGTRLALSETKGAKSTLGRGSHYQCQMQQNHRARSPALQPQGHGCSPWTPPALHGPVRCGRLVGRLQASGGDRAPGGTWLNTPVPALDIC